MFDTRFGLDSPTGARLDLSHAGAKGPERGILLILHGLAEHAARYGRFAGEMAERGFHVYAHDHRGHGSTTAPDAPLRRFAKTHGPVKVVADCLAVLKEATSQHRDLPVIVFGHSMGGFIAMNFAILHADLVGGLALWNASLSYGVKERLAVTALKAERALKGSDVASEFFARGTFGAWGRSIEPRRTPADWLSHDERQVDAYLADPLCGWTPTNSMALDILALIREGVGEAQWSRLPSSLPIHLLGGTEDPATGQGEAMQALAGGLRHSGSRDVTLVLQEGARHETLNEVEAIRAGALQALDGWLDRVAPVL